jgi:hypothetical protein
MILLFGYIYTLKKGFFKITVTFWSYTSFKTMLQVLVLYTIQPINVVLTLGLFLSS